MSVRIVNVVPDSPADRRGVLPDERLVAINGREVRDFFDYRFFVTEKKVDLLLENTAGARRTVTLRKGEYDDIGLEFDSFLMDSVRTCRNKCVFCFIDQLPPGMRETVYLKDDDERMSFLFGNYVTLTNLGEQDIRRIIEMRFSPVNISVHTTNPALRCRMLGNRFAGESLEVMRRLAEAEIGMNGQIVVCPGLNDGEELRSTLRDLSSMYPAMASVSVVPVGLTKYRQGLYPLQPVGERESVEILQICDEIGDQNLLLHGVRVVYPSDELFLKAGRAIPCSAYYDGFPQLENGVGLLAALRDEFFEALQNTELPVFTAKRRVSAATGTAACGMLQFLVDAVSEKCNNLHCTVHPIINDFFGHTVDVAGLLTGGDIKSQLRGKDLGDLLLLPRVMFKAQDNIFLDDVSIRDVEEALGVRTLCVDVGGSGLLNALLYG